MLVLSQAEVEQLLDLDALVEAIAARWQTSAGAGVDAGAVAADVEERSGFLAVMPAYVPAERALTTKLVSLFPLNEGTDTPTHQALIAVFDARTGAARPDRRDARHGGADGGRFGAVRAPARARGRHDARRARDGGEGRAHARAVVRVRPVEEVLLAGPTLSGRPRPPPSWRRSWSWVRPRPTAGCAGSRRRLRLHRGGRGRSCGASGWPPAPT